VKQFRIDFVVNAQRSEGIISSDCATIALQLQDICAKKLRQIRINNVAIAR
jgi:hypothetical protein